MNKQEANELIERIKKERATGGMFTQIVHMDNVITAINSMVEPEFKVGDWACYKYGSKYEHMFRVGNVSEYNITPKHGDHAYNIEDCTKVVSIQLSGETEFAQGKWARLTENTGDWKKGTEVLIYKKPSLGVTVWSCVKVDSQECQIVPESELEMP